MSRSIHETWSEYRESARYRYTDRELRRKLLREMRESLYKKRRIKDVVLRDRIPAARPSEYVTPDAVPIEVRDVRPGVFYPASPADIRALLWRLPPDAYAGIRKIELCLGKERINEYVLEEEGELDPDPLTGRSGYEEFDGLHGPGILGTRFDDGTIQLYAYVKTKELEHWPVVELYLRKCMLETLLHELAHHQDAMIRVGRGRWRMDDKDKDEAYARRQGHCWSKEHVVPVLERAYPDEVEALEQWVERHAGARVALSDLFTMYHELGLDCFGMLLRAALNPEERESPLGIDLARYLMWCRNCACARGVIERYLSEHPQSAEAHAVRAQILLDSKEPDQACKAARAALALAADEIGAWGALLSGLEKLQSWPELLLESERARSSEFKRSDGARPGRNGSFADTVRCKEALALINLGRHEEALAITTPVFGEPRQVQTSLLHVVALLGAGRNEEALAASTATLEQGNKWRTRVWGEELHACRFVAAARLGRLDLARAYLEREEDPRYPPMKGSFCELFDSWVPQCRAKLGVT